MFCRKQIPYPLGGKRLGTSGTVHEGNAAVSKKQARLRRLPTLTAMPPTGIIAQYPESGHHTSSLSTTALGSGSWQHASQKLLQNSLDRREANREKRARTVADFEDRAEAGVASASGIAAGVEHQDHCLSVFYCLVDPF